MELYKIMVIVVNTYALISGDCRCLEAGEVHTLKETQSNWKISTRPVGKFQTVQYFNSSSSDAIFWKCPHTGWSEVVIISTPLGKQGKLDHIWSRQRSLLSVKREIIMLGADNLINPSLAHLLRYL